MNTNDLKKEAREIISEHCRYCDMSGDNHEKCKRDIEIEHEEMDNIIDRAYTAGLQHAEKIARRESIYWAVDSPNETVNQGEYVSRRIMEEIKDEII